MCALRVREGGAQMRLSRVSVYGIGRLVAFSGVTGASIIDRGLAVWFGQSRFWGIYRIIRYGVRLWEMFLCINPDRGVEGLGSPRYGTHKQH